jgi:hypothetical protein
MLASHAVRRQAHSLARGVASWSKFNPAAMSGANPAQVSNLGEAAAVTNRSLRRTSPRHRHASLLPHAAVCGEWVQSEKTIAVPDPLNGEPFITVSNWAAPQGTAGQGDTTPPANNLPQRCQHCSSPTMYPSAGSPVLECCTYPARACRRAICSSALLRLACMPSLAATCVIKGLFCRCMVVYAGAGHPGV